MKKIISLILALIMTVGMLPSFSALAEEPEKSGMEELIEL